MITVSQLSSLLDGYTYFYTDKGRLTTIDPSVRKERRARQQRASYERNKDKWHYRKRVRRFKEQMGE